MATMPLKQVNNVEILTILENQIDILLASTEHAKRFPPPPDLYARESLVAEHGFSALVKVHCGNTSETLLFDAGLSKYGFTHNMDVLESLRSSTPLS